MATATAVGGLAVATDLALVLWSRCVPTWEGFGYALEGRGTVAVVALAAHLRLADGDLTSCGLQFSPRQGWRWWGKVSLRIGLAVAGCVVAGLGVWVLAGQAIPRHVTPPGDLAWSLLHTCVFAPVQEEAVYRLGLCAPLAARLGPWRAVAASGVAFAGLHVVGGSPSPENLAGGLFLAWAFLKSESVAVPVLLHALGNGCALAAQVGAWYWLPGDV